MQYMHSELLRYDTPTPTAASRLMVTGCCSRSWLCQVGALVEALDCGLCKVTIHCCYAVLCINPLRTSLDLWLAHTAPACAAGASASASAMAVHRPSPPASSVPGSLHSSQRSPWPGCTADARRTCSIRTSTQHPAPAKQSASHCSGPGRHRHR